MTHFSVQRTCKEDAIFAYLAADIDRNIEVTVDLFTNIQLFAMI